MTMRLSMDKQKALSGELSRPPSCGRKSQRGSYVIPCSYVIRCGITQAQGKGKVVRGGRA